MDERRRRQQEYHAFLDAQVREGDERRARERLEEGGGGAALVVGDGGGVNDPLIFPPLPMESHSQSSETRNINKRRLLHYAQAQQQQQQQGEAEPGGGVGGGEMRLLCMLNEERSARVELQGVVEWLSEQVKSAQVAQVSTEDRLQSGRHKQSEDIASVQDRLRVAETELLEARAWREAMERNRSDDRASGASQILAELQSRTEEARQRHEVDEARWLQYGQQLRDMRSEQERVNGSYGTGMDGVRERLGQLEALLGSEAGRVDALNKRGSDDAAAGVAGRNDLLARIDRTAESIVRMEGAVEAEAAARRTMRADFHSAQDELRSLVLRTEEGVARQFESVSSVARAAEDDAVAKGEWRAKLVEGRAAEERRALETRLTALEALVTGDHRAGQEKAKRDAAELQRRAADLETQHAAGEHALRAQVKGFRVEVDASIDSLRAELKSHTSAVGTTQKQWEQSMRENLGSVHSSLQKVHGDTERRVGGLEEVLRAEITARARDQRRMQEATRQLQRAEEAGLMESTKVLAAKMEAISSTSRDAAAAAEDAKRHAEASVAAAGQEHASQLAECVERCEELVGAASVRVDQTVAGARRCARDSARAVAELHKSMSVLDAHAAQSEAAVKRHVSEMERNIATRIDAADRRLAVACAEKAARREALESSVGADMEALRSELASRVELNDSLSLAAADTGRLVAACEARSAEACRTVAAQSADAAQAKLDSRSKAILDEVCAAEQRGVDALEASRKEIAAEHVTMAENTTALVQPLVRRLNEHQQAISLCALGHDLKALSDSSAERFAAIDREQRRAADEWLKKCVELDTARADTERRMNERAALLIAGAEAAMAQRVSSEAAAVRSVLTATVQREAAERAQTVAEAMSSCSDAVAAAATETRAEIVSTSEATRSAFGTKLAGETAARMAADQEAWRRAERQEEDWSVRDAVAHAVESVVVRIEQDDAEGKMLALQHELDGQRAAAAEESVLVRREVFLKLALVRSESDRRFAHETSLRELGDKRVIGTLRGCVTEMGEEVALRVAEEARERRQDVQRLRGVSHEELAAEARAREAADEAIVAGTARELEARGALQATLTATAEAEAKEFRTGLASLLSERSAENAAQFSAVRVRADELGGQIQSSADTLSAEVQSGIDALKAGIEERMEAGNGELREMLTSLKEQGDKALDAAKSDLNAKIDTHEGGIKSLEQREQEAQQALAGLAEKLDNLGRREQADTAATEPSNPATTAQRQRPVGTGKPHEQAKLPPLDVQLDEVTEKAVVKELSPRLVDGIVKEASSKASADLSDV